MNKDFTIISNYDGLALQGILYEPTTPPKGILHIAHGMYEHKESYEKFMQFLASQGYVAACHDQRGHGDSVARKEDLGWFRDKNGKAFVEDCVQVTQYLREAYPNLPVTLLGHSMGSMVARCYLREHDDLIDKVILSGSPTNNPMSGVGVMLAKLVALFRGDHHCSKLLIHISTGKKKEEFIKAGKGSWLTHDEELAKAIKKDPKRQFRFTTNGFENLFNLMKYTYKKRGYLLKNPSLPIHFVSGSDDIVLGGEQGWVKTLAFMREVGYQNVSGKLYTDMRHEVLNEIGKEEAYNDLLQFIQS